MEFIEIAFEEAKKSSQPVKCGAVVVKDNEVIAKSHNSQRKEHDPSSHAEMNAIRAAANFLGTKKLNRCIVYSTHEPCVMCLSAMSFAEIGRLVYRIPLADAWSGENRINISIDEFMDKTIHKFDIKRSNQSDTL